MPWRETQVLGQRIAFVEAYLDKRDPRSMTELCQDFGVSRKTGYKTLQRSIDCGLGGLDDGSRAPHRHPNETSTKIVQLLLDARIKHPRWGPRKLLVWLDGRHPGLDWPAPSTVGEILKRYGLVVARRRPRPRTPVYEQPFAAVQAPNDSWSADFKGWFYTGDGRRCDPLTISDNYSRFLLLLKAVRHPDFRHVQPEFERAFRDYGLPGVIRTDNGPPFASVGIGGLSRLSVWLIRLGVIPERIEPGKPQQNGRHERMHETLKADVASPPKSTWRAQQRAFTFFRREYNFERPHESLDNRTPAELYEPSRRAFPRRLPELEYPDDCVVRRVRKDGAIKWRHRHLYLSEALAGEIVGLEQATDRDWRIWFGPVEIGSLDDDQQEVCRNRLQEPGGNAVPSTEELAV